MKRTLECQGAAVIEPLRTLLTGHGDCDRLEQAARFGRDSSECPQPQKPVAASPHLAGLGPEQKSRARC